ncbi:MAG: type II toxin-antitoxin system VapB family antitoxin [Chlorobi bacterium]|nr:type II toxin-antitoxin system VapB family antitoxin [Chlorobiota bacterium]
MRTTLNIEDSLLEKATMLTGVKEKTLLVKMGLEALIKMENYRRLAKLGGTEKDLKKIGRRRIN